MKNKILWLRISYWTGAVADGFFAVALAHPKLWGLALGIASFNPDPQHRADMGVGASLMFSWTCLLLWADQKPVERKGVLFLTVLPALTCLVITGIYAVVSGANSLANMIPVFVLQALLISLFTFSYLHARH